MLNNKILLLMGFSLLFIKINTLIADISLFYFLTNALGMSILMYETKGNHAFKKFFNALKIGQVINGSLLLLNSSLYLHTGNNLRTIAIPTDNLLLQYGGLIIQGLFIINYFLPFILWLVFISNAKKYSTFNFARIERASYSATFAYTLVTFVLIPNFAFYRSMILIGLTICIFFTIASVVLNKLTTS